MPAAKQNDTVQVHYTGKLDDGTIFDSSRNGDPLQFTLGVGQVIPGFDNAILGMAVGDTKTVHIPVDQAYGEHREDLIMEVTLDQFPAVPEIGQHFELRTQSGQAIPTTVAAVTDSTATLDANHPLAGQPLTFDLELVAIG
ncbi:MAG: peptidylprolyl isomerase [Anaerolineae bacterium]|nr:peptidylprolyl isomerase [Anaerolineae bacterium]